LWIDKDNGVVNRINFNFIQLPVNFQYHLHIDRSTVLLQAGTYFGYNLGGKYSEKVTSGGESVTTSTDIKLGGDPVRHFAKPFDFGFNYGVGLQSGNIQMGLS